MDKFLTEILKVKPLDHEISINPSINNEDNFVYVKKSWYLSN